MPRLANTYGDVLWSIMHSLGCEVQTDIRPRDKDSSEWDQDSDIGNILVFSLLLEGPSILCVICRAMHCVIALKFYSTVIAALHFPTNAAAAVTFGNHASTHRDLQWIAVNCGGSRTTHCIAR